MTSFGESHGVALGVVIEGCPAGVVYNEGLLLACLAARRPGGSSAVSSRAEIDKPEIVSGVFEGKTLGTPITVIVRNADAKSEDYTEIKKTPRPGHADDVWLNKFGVADYRGGGRSSGRETVARVIAGAFARMFIDQATKEFQLTVFPRQIGPLIQTDELVVEGSQNNTWNLIQARA